MIFVLLADGTLLFCTVMGGAMTPAYSLSVPLGGDGGEGAVRALPHPVSFGGALVVVEGAWGFTAIDMQPRWGLGEKRGVKKFIKFKIAGCLWKSVCVGGGKQGLKCRGVFLFFSKNL